MAKTVRKGFHALKRSTRTNTKELAEVIKERWKGKGYTARVYKQSSGYKVTGVQEGAKKCKHK